MADQIVFVDNDTVECGEFTLDKVAGDWCYIEFEGEHIIWTNEQCDQLYELLSFRRNLIEEDL